MRHIPASFRCAGSRFVAVLLALFVAAPAVAQTTFHVAKDNPGAEAPFASWETAAPDIQTAVDAASSGDLVLVADGVYDAGERTTADDVANRIVVPDGITVRSANGPAAAILLGGEDVRGAALLGLARLEGFTLTGARGVGGLWGEDGTPTAENCRIHDNTGIRGGGAYGLALVDCVLENNAASLRGGGAFECFLTGGTLAGNTAEHGGGAAASVLWNSLVISNSATEAGGGAYESLLRNCLVAGNSAGTGGGAANSDLFSSTVVANRAGIAGGLHGGEAFNCVVFLNSLLDDSPDNWEDVTFHYSCTDPPPPGDDNFADDPLFVAPDQYNFRLSEGSPGIDAGVNQGWMATAVDLDGRPRILDETVDVGAYEFEVVPTPDPQLAVQGPDGQPITSGVDPDPALGTVWNARAGQNDSRTFSLVNDGNAPLVVSAMDWAGPDAAAFSVPLFPLHVASETSEPFLVVFSPDDPRPHEADLLIHHSASNAPSPFVVRFLCTGVLPADRYVSAYNPGAAEPFETWDTAAADIQSAIDVSLPGDTIWVAEGDYDTGETIGPDGVLHRIVVLEPIAIRSMEGPFSATIWGADGIRGAYLGPGAILDGFTISGGENAGGIRCADETAIVTNCFIVGNSAEAGGGVNGGTIVDSLIMGNSADIGGGAFNAVLHNCQLGSNQAELGGGAADSELFGCTLLGNIASDSGGGAYGSVLHECRLSDNLAVGEFGSGGGAANSTLYSCLLQENESAYGGGAFDSFLHNCTVVENTASVEGGGVHGGEIENTIVFFNLQGLADDNLHFNVTATYSCTIPLPPGAGNLDADPEFVNRAEGDFRLATNSPCINTGIHRFWMEDALDLAGNLRAVGPAVDLGAYEHPFTPSGIDAWWLKHNNLPWDGSEDFGDADEDGFDNYSEWYAHTDPNDPLSLLALERPPSLIPPEGTGWVVRWQSVTSRTYYIERATNLLDDPSFHPLAGPIPGEDGFTTYHDLTAPPHPPSVYRILLP